MPVFLDDGTYSLMLLGVGSNESDCVRVSLFFGPGNKATFLGLPWAFLKAFFRQVLLYPLAISRSYRRSA